MKKLSVEAFLEKAQNTVVFDVRSPGEYLHAHIPGALSMPLFSNEERAVVGTAYKQQSREQAIKIGLDYFGPKMRALVEQVEKILGPNSKTVQVHCWRGGMRSGAVAWLLDMYGFEVYTLAGGYKAFRNWALARFDEPYSLNILGGYTGSAKTEVLQQLARQGQAVIDLEALAQHKGSALGGIGQPAQPSQEMFENMLATKLDALKTNKIWLEDESQRIGNLKIPNSLKEQMQQANLYFLDVPVAVRLHYLVTAYGKLPTEQIINAIIRIQKRLGGLDTKNAVAHLIEGDTKACFEILLRYYDKYYGKALAAKPTQNTKTIAVETMDITQMCQALLPLNN